MPGLCSVTVTARLPWAGLQTPLAPGCSLHWCDRGFLGCWRFLLGDLRTFGCSTNGLLRWPLGMVVTAALCRRDLARLRSPLRFQMKYFSFMWSSFTSCSYPFLSEKRYMINVIYICVHIYLYTYMCVCVYVYIYLLDTFIPKKC